MLDAGPQNFRKTTHVFITHTHADHIAELPLSLMHAGQGDGSKITIHCPADAVRHLQTYITAFFQVNAVCDCSMNDFCRFVPLEAPKQTHRLTLKGDIIEVASVGGDHTVPTILYGFALIKQKLLPQFASLSGKAIAQLRKEGQNVTAEVVEPKFAYVLDTSIEGLMAASWLLDYPVVIVECTFLLPDEKKFTHEKKHIHWDDLQPMVLARPETLFILVHFSQRHSDPFVREFFEAQHIANVHPWVLA